jgi:hypothetical protein
MDAVSQQLTTDRMVRRRSGGDDSRVNLTNDFRKIREWRDTAFGGEPDGGLFQRVNDADQLDVIQFARELGVKTAQMSGADNSKAKHVSLVQSSEFKVQGSQASNFKP